MYLRIIRLALLCVALAGAARAGVPAPQDVLGFTPGDDRRLASWAQIVDYFQKLDAASERVKFAEIGKTTLGAPFVYAAISAPENLAKLDYYKDIQRQLADPRTFRSNDAKARQLIAKGKTIVLITCGIHSTEVGSTLSSALIAYRLAAGEDAEIKKVLQETIILLVPSLNPDGVDIVKRWYDKTLGTPYEGTGPPELYHHYTGHDNNRDWYAFTQVETQLTVDHLHNAWHPQIVHDIHQQGVYGARLFLPPYMKPVEPNVPAQIVEGYTELGEYMAQQLRAQGLKGVTNNSTYDAWTPARAYSHYHGGVRILSETASCNLASPVTIPFEKLKSPGDGFDPQKESANFGPVWPGGEWRLRDITNTMTAAAAQLLNHAANNREKWLTRFYEIGKEAVRPRKKGELVGFVIEDGPTASDAIFERAMVKQEYSDEFNRIIINGRRLPDGASFVPMAQPYNGFAKALLEKQTYPNLQDAEGHPIAPYDVTAHTVALLMGFKATPVYTLPRYKKIPLGSYVSNTLGCRTNSANPFGARKSSDIALYQSSAPVMDEGWTRLVLDNAGKRYSSIRDAAIREGKLTYNLNPWNEQPLTAIIIPDQSPRQILNGYAKGAMPDELTGGLGAEGVAKLREYVEAGGTLITLNRASEFAVEQFNLPVRDVTAGLSQKDFYVPGSILRAELDTRHPIAAGMPRESIAWAEDSPFFEVAPNAKNVRVIAWYPKDKDPLLSGWLLGGDKIKGRAALVEVILGKGRIILFGFRPQYRGQSVATFPLLFNAMSSAGK
jgi:hypothetical protein